MSDLGSVTITAKEVYDKLMEVSTKITELSVTVTMIPERLSDHERRIDSIERKLWMAAGFAGALGTGVGTALSKILGG